MKKGVFGGWFREFATLVFTQTVQAFLLAIVMTIVISATKGKGEGQNTYAAGLLAVIALSQFNKIEMLVKQIFGVTSGFANEAMRMNPGGLTMGGMMALRGAKRVADNAGKIVGGAVGGAYNAGKVGYLKHLQKKQGVAENDANEAENSANLALDTAQGLADDFVDASHAGASVNVATGQLGGGYSQGSGGGLGVSSSDIRQLTDAVKAQTQALKDSGKSSGSAPKLGKDASIEDRIEAARSARNNSLKKMGSGALETVGAIAGAGAGLGVGLVGAAVTGDLSGQKIMNASLSGAGVGDKMGESTARGIGNVGSEIAGYSRANKTVDKNIKEANERKQNALAKKNMYDKVSKEIGELKAGKKSNVQKRQGQVRDVIKNNRIDAGNL